MSPSLFHVREQILLQPLVILHPQAGQQVVLMLEDQVLVVILHKPGEDGAEE